MRYFFLLCSVIFGNSLFAQNGIVSGSILDSQTNSPISESHIFIPGTAIQTFSDSLGVFNLKGLPTGAWDLAVMKEGYLYQSKSIVINQANTGSKLDILLNLKPNLETDENSAKQQKKLERDFLEWLEVESGSKEELKLINPEVLIFQKNEETKGYWVNTKEALLVQNLKTSYLMTVYFKESVKMDGEIIPDNFLISYLELKPGSEEEKELINKNRIQIYESSPTYALRMLLGEQDGPIDIKPSDQDGQFLLFLSSPLVLDNGSKSIAFKNNELLVRVNGIAIHPDNLITSGFSNSSNPFTRLPLDFDYDKVSTLAEVQKTPETLMERVFLHTDKDIYLMGEELFFKAYMIFGNPLLVEESSKVLHVEILDSSGYSMVHRIFPIENGMAQGKIPLTPEFNTRDFIVKSYTIWGANYGEEFEFYKPIQVYINYSELESNSLGELSEGITVFADKEVYLSQDSVTLNIIARNKIGSISGANLSVSIISEKSNLLINPERSEFVNYAAFTPEIKLKQTDSFQFEKELGFTLVGKIKDENILIDKSKVEVLVDNFLDKRELLADKEGLFYLKGLQKSGEFSVLIKARNNQDRQLDEFELSLLQSPNMLNLSAFEFPSPPLVKRPLERVDSLQRAYLALREGEILLEEVEVKSTRKIDSRSMPFGRAPIVLEMKDVYLTGDTQQFIYSLANRTGLRAAGIPPMLINPRGYPGGPPVILLNGNPITSVLGPSIGSNPQENQFQALQSINIFTIERIEVIKSIIPLLGEAGRFGAVNIITKVGQYVASNEKPYQEFQLQGLEESKPLPNPLYSFPSTTLHWNPEVKISPNQTSTSLKFKLPEDSEPFWVIVNGVNASGEPVSGRILLNENKLGSN